MYVDLPRFIVSPVVFVVDLLRLHELLVAFFVDSLMAI